MRHYSVAELIKTGERLKSAPPWPEDRPYTPGPLASACREVDFRHVRISGVEEASRAFGAPVRFAASREGLASSRTGNIRRLSAGNRWVAEQLTKLATALAAEATPFASLQERELVSPGRAQPNGTGLALRMAGPLVDASSEYCIVWSSG